MRYQQQKRDKKMTQKSETPTETEQSEQRNIRTAIYTYKQWNLDTYTHTSAHPPTFGLSNIEFKHSSLMS